MYVCARNEATEQLKLFSNYITTTEVNQLMKMYIFVTSIASIKHWLWPRRLLVLVSNKMISNTVSVIIINITFIIKKLSKVSGQRSYRETWHRNQVPSNLWRPAWYQILQGSDQSTVWSSAALTSISAVNSLHRRTCSHNATKANN